MIERVLVAGGDRGGHLFPGIAVVEELRRRIPSIDVLFVGPEDGFQVQALQRARERHAAVHVQRVGAGVSELARGVVSLPRNALQGWGAVRRFRPDLVIGLGGPVSRAVLASASALRVPTVLLERHATTNLASLLLGRSTERAYATGAESGADASKTVGVQGQPVRRAIVDAARVAASDPAGVEARARTVLVLGGSRGSAALNVTLPDALQRAGVSQLGLTVVHQTGPSMVQQVQRSYRDHGVRAEVVPFIDDMARAYLGAALVVARAGAGTMAELCAIGRPAILVPDSHATRDPRFHGAGALHNAQAAISIPAPALEVTGAANHIRSLLTDRARRSAMADAARRFGRPDAAAAIVDDLFAWLGLSTESSATATPAHAEPATQLPATNTGDAPIQASPSAQRRPKVRRAELRIRPVELTLQTARISRAPA